MYISGKNVVKEYLHNNDIKKAYLFKKFNDQDILYMLSKKNIETKFLEKHELDKMVKENHQGIILEIPDFEYKDIESINDELVVILDHIEDPHNFGAIIRTCEAADIKNIIIPKDRACQVTPTVIKVSTGTINSVNIIRVTNLNNAIDYLKKNGFWIVGTDMEGTLYQDIDYSGKIAIIIGNEGNGMKELTKKNCDFIASIKMKGKVNSLNASVAAGIIIFEAIKKRG